MKLPCSAIGNNSLKISVIILLALAAFTPVRAENTNAPAAIDADVSQFPGKDKLPGKVPPNVWTGLAGVWSRDHDQWKTNSADQTGGVVFLGDSITEGWHTLAQDFPNLKVINRGIGGDITSGVLYRLYADVLRLKPVAIVLLIGTNDVGNNEDAADVADNIKEILAAIKKFDPNIKVIICKTMPRMDRVAGTGYQPTHDEQIKKLNGLVADLVKTEPNVAVCDTYSIFLDNAGKQIAGDFNNDHLHLNASGYAIWKTALDPVLVQMKISTGAAK